MKHCRHYTHRRSAYKARMSVLKWPLFKILLFSFGPLLSVFLFDYFNFGCPNTALVRNISGTGLAIILPCSFLTLVSGFILLGKFGFLIDDCNYKTPDPVYVKKFANYANLCLTFFVLSQLTIAYGASFYYFVTPTNVTVRNGFFNQPREYKWADVTSLKISCDHHRRGRYEFFSTTKVDVLIETFFRDGTSIFLNQIRVPTALQLVNKSQTKDGSLSQALYTYDNQDPSVCPSEISGFEKSEDVY